MRSMDGDSISGLDGNYGVDLFELLNEETSTGIVNLNSKFIYRRVQRPPINVEKTPTVKAVEIIRYHAAMPYVLGGSVTKYQGIDETLKYLRIDHVCVLDLISTSTSSPPSNIRMNLGSGSLTASTVNGTRVTGGGVILRKGGSNGQAPVLEIPSGGAILFGNTWIKEKHLRILTGQTDIKIQNDHYPGRTLDSGGYSGDNDSRPKSIQKGGIAYMKESGDDKKHRRWTLKPW